jgi:hypothetical protein
MEGNYTCTIQIDKSPEEVFSAIKNVGAWWVGQVEGDASHLGSKFIYKYKAFHKSEQTVTELVPNSRIIWHVDAATLPFVKNQSEWEGTEIVFEISVKKGGSEIKFTHRGLTPELECFNSCSGGWNFYITKSLKSFLTTGRGLDPAF